jgi:carbon monoxide dehydrogenase subunit G
MPEDRAMKLENVIHIDATPEVVWAATEDIGRWHEWSPFVDSITRRDDGPFGVGSQASIKQQGLPEAIWRVTAFDRRHRFTWESRVRGIDMVATHEVHPDGDGTRSVLRIEMSGLAATLLAPLLHLLVTRSLKLENRGLKAFCEARETRRPQSSPRPI